MTSIQINSKVCIFEDMYFLCKNILSWIYLFIIMWLEKKGPRFARILRWPRRESSKKLWIKSALSPAHLFPFASKHLGFYSGSRPKRGKCYEWLWKRKGPANTLMSGNSCMKRSKQLNGRHNFLLWRFLGLRMAPSPSWDLFLETQTKRAATDKPPYIYFEHFPQWFQSLNWRFAEELHLSKSHATRKVASARPG
jgi:hypothetical protein